VSFSEFWGTLFGWFAELISWIFNWIPRMAVIRWDEFGIFYRGGEKPFKISHDKPMPRWWRVLWAWPIPSTSWLHVTPKGWKAKVAGLQGIHWYCPNISEIEKHHRSRMVLIIENLPLETGDETPQQVEVGGVLTYHIVDPVVFDAENFDADESIATVAQGELQEIVTTGEWAKVKKSATNRKGEESRVGQALVGKFNDRLKIFGVEIESFRFREQIRLGRGGAMHAFGIEFGNSEE
jgi:hypothetical protein